MCRCTECQWAINAKDARIAELEAKVAGLTLSPDTVTRALLGLRDRRAVCATRKATQATDAALDDLNRYAREAGR